MATLVLASASPARLRLLRAAGLEPEVIVSGVDESAVDASDAGTLSGTLAQLKAEAVAASLRAAAGSSAAGLRAAAGSSAAGRPAAARPGTLVLGCDSVLAFDGEILGKPVDADDAVRRWKSQRGASGILHTGHHLIDLDSGASVAEVARTTVHFADPDDDEIAAYVASGEPLAVAGAFTIDGLGGVFVERIEGDHTNVVGLSMPLLRRLLRRLDVRITDLWRQP